MPVLRPLILASLLTITASAAAYADTATVRVYAPYNTRLSYAVTIPVIGEGPTIVTVHVRPSRRYLYAQRALFQNWTGFRKQYSGRKYPF